MVSHAREAEWAWDDAIGILRSIRCKNENDMLNHAYTRAQTVPPGLNGKATTGAHQRTSALLDLLHTRDAQLREARFRGCELVMDRWERIWNYRRLLGSMKKRFWMWRRVTRQKMRTAAFTAKRQRRGLGKTFVLFRSAALLTACNKHRLFRTKLLLHRKKCGLFFGTWQEVTAQKSWLRVLEFQHAKAAVRSTMKTWKDKMQAAKDGREIEVKESVIVGRLFHRRSKMHFKNILKTWQRLSLISVLRRNIKRDVKILTWRAFVALVTFFREWRKSVTETLRFRHLTYKVAHKVFRAAEYWAMKTWISFTREKRKSQCRLRQVVGRMMMRRMAATFVSWKTSIRLKHVNNANISRVVRLMKNRASPFAFSTWRLQYEESVRKSVLNTKIIFRLKNICLIRSYQLWLDATGESKRQRSVIGKMVARICNVTMVLALETWKQTVRVAARKKRIMIKTLSRLQKSRLMSCFEWWKDATCESKRQRSVIGKMVARICNVTMVLALETWKQTVSEAAREKRVMIKTLSHLQKSRLMSCFEWWKDATCESKRQRSVIGKMVARICKVTMVLALETWKQTVRVAAREKRVMIKTLSRLQKRSLMSCFEWWKDATCESKRQRSVIGKMVARICKVTMVLALETWKQTVGEKKIMIKTLSHLQRKGLQNRSLMSCFECWKVVTFEKWANEANNSIENQNLAAPEREMNFRRDMVSEEMPGKMALSPNTVRIAKVFFQWACNIWWARELTMQHERFVMILQQREARHLLEKWESVMKSPQPLRSGSPPSKQFAKIVGAGARNWDHVYEARDSHRVSGVHSSSSKYSTFDAFASPESLEASPSKSHRTPTPATPPNTIYSTPRKSQQYGRSPVASKMVFSHSKQS